VFALWLLMLVTPFLIAPAGKEAFRQPKLMAGEWLGLASLFLFAWGVGRLERVRLAAVWRHPAVQGVAPMLLVATLGLAVTRHPFHFREALADLWIGAACLAGWSLALAPPRMERVLRWLLLPAALMAFLGILQAHQLWEPLHFVGIEPGERFAVTSLAGNPGDLASYLVLPCLIAQWALARRLRGGEPVSSLRVWGPGLALAVCLYALARTQTLAALGALLAGSVIFWLSLLPRRRMVSALAGTSALAAVLVVAVTPLRERVVYLLQTAGEGDLNSALSGRFDGWNAAAFMLSEHPLAGVGQGGYLPEFSPAKLTLLAKGVPFFQGHMQPVFANPHSEFLAVAAEWGVPGLLALAWGLWVLWRALRRGGPAGEDRALAFAGVAALAVLALVHFPFRTALVGFPAVLFLAWVFRRGAPAEVEAGSGGVKGSLLMWPLVLLLGFALFQQTGRLRTRGVASRILHRVELLSMAAVSAGKAPPRLFMDNLQALDRAAALDPSEIGIPIARGTQYLLLGQPDAAIRSYTEAIELEPRPEAYLNLGRAQIAAGRLDEARLSFQRAVQLDPRLDRQVPPVAR
jgi:O-antigen ligase